ncbi:MAG: T9SS type A sorting domain-containing protein [Flavobacterium sp.]|nr:MAG: T9SS type A sorting domain-containing protein [Flavobacterium sp.]
MKQFYTLILSLITISASAQIINIPDANFKAALVSQFDFNSNGEIEQSEADAVTNITVLNLQIASLSGIENFHNLQTLSCSGNVLTNINGNIAGLGNLQNIDCADNQLTTLDVSNLPIRDLRCQNNQITQLTHTSEWMYLFDISYNQLTNVVVPRLVWSDTDYLNISGNLYTSITFAPNTIAVLTCENTMLTSLDLSGFEINAGIDVSVIANNPNLEYVNLKNGFSDRCFECLEYGLYILDNPNIALICVDDLSSYDPISQQSYSEAEIFQESAASVSTYCSFTPGGNFNTITGNIKLDLDGNGCDSNDLNVPNISVSQSSGTGTLGETFTNSAGNFSCYVTQGQNQTLTPHFENPYFSISPASYTSSFSGFGNTETVNFCIAPNGIHPDLKITIIPVTAARPGFDAVYKIHVENKGTETASGEISVQFNDALTYFVSANPAIASQNGNFLVWNFSNLAPFASQDIVYTLNINSPTDNPPVNVGGVLEFNASVDSGADETPGDNQFIFQQIVVGSFDPNDKAVSRNIIDIGETDDYLYYTVRFQNMGTFAAGNVVVKDMLSDKLDSTSVEMVSASHQMRSTLTSGNKLEFFFEGIDLPPASDNEAASHGYVTFRIKPKEDILLYDVIANSAEIYFDFNFPVITNEVTTTVNALGTSSFAGNNFVIYPNPARNSFTIDLIDNFTSRIEIYNVLGQMVKSVQADTRQTTVDISMLPSGTYIVKISGGKATMNKKLLKL